VWTDQHSPDGFSVGCTSAASIQSGTEELQVWWYNHSMFEGDKTLASRHFSRVWLDKDRVGAGGTAVYDYNNRPKCFEREAKGEYERVLYIVDRSQILVSNFMLKNRMIPLPIVKHLETQLPQEIKERICQRQKAK
jgi:hypothetical protein